MRAGRVVGHHQRVEDEEAKTLMLEALFDIRSMVSDIHELVMRIEDENGEEEEEEDT